MNDMPQDAWFYSREGERIGPVPFSELQIKAKEGTLNPRLDMAWTHGMAEWKPSGEIEGLFERRATPEPREVLSPTADPYKTPTHQSAADQMEKQEDWPGARRRSYLFAILILPFLLNFIVAWASVMFKEQLGAQIAGWILTGAPILILVISVYYGIQRLANLGMSRWWFLGNFVPFLNIWIGYRCFACPGGYAYHKKLDGIGVFLAIVYWLFVVTIVLAVAAVVAILLGAAGNPEIQQRIQELLNQAAPADA